MFQLVVIIGVKCEFSCPNSRKFIERVLGDWVFTVTSLNVGLERPGLVSRGGTSSTRQTVTDKLKKARFDPYNLTLLVEKRRDPLFSNVSNKKSRHLHFYLS